MIIDMSYWTRVLKRFLYVILILISLHTQLITLFGCGDFRCSWSGIYHDSDAYASTAQNIEVYKKLSKWYSRL